MDCMPVQWTDDTLKGQRRPSHPLRCSFPLVLRQTLIARAGVGWPWTGVGLGYTITADPAEVRSGVSAARLAVASSSAGISQTVDVAVRVPLLIPLLSPPGAPAPVHTRARSG